MKHLQPKKSAIDWYFARVNGRIVLPDTKEQKLPHSVREPHVETENLEARHRSAWRRCSRFFFSAGFLTIILSPEAFAATAKTEPAPSKSLVSKEAGYVQPAAASSTAAAAKKKNALPARDPELEKIATVAKSAQGTVTGVSRQGIAVEYGTDPQKGGMEIWFTYVEKMKLTGFTALSDLGEGDTVAVSYKQAPDHRKLVDEIKLIAKKTVEPPEPLLEAAETP